MGTSWHHPVMCDYESGGPVATNILLCRATWTGDYARSVDGILVSSSLLGCSVSDDDFSAKIGGACCSYRAIAGVRARRLGGRSRAEFCVPSPAPECLLCMEYNPQCVDDESAARDIVSVPMDHEVSHSENN